jgi:serine/threonine protein kinase
MINQYKLLKTLGKGSYGKVKLAERKLLDKTEYFAIKILKKTALKR